MSDCIFCRIVRGEVPCKKVFEDESVLALWDIQQQAPVHILVIPKRHLRSAMDLTPGDGELLSHLFAALRIVARDQGVAETGFRILANTGPDSGQQVDHLHFHLMGGRKLGPLA